MNDLMDGFPPDPSGQVTLANWRTAPFNAWAFHHVREIVPSADIANDPSAAWPLNSAISELDDIQIDADDDQRLSFHEFLTSTNCDGLLVLHRGQIVYETYANGLTEHTPHILMSVSKSLTGLLAGIMASQGLLDPDAPVTDNVPELAKTAYVGATVRNLLDMRAGILFNEDYSATLGPIIQYRKATNWNPLAAGEPASDLRTFCQSLTRRDGDHGDGFQYVSPNTDLLAWGIERAAGQRFADLMSKHLWQPLGAEWNAYVTVDRLGAPRAAGGICATARDLARVGQLMIQHGRRGEIQVIPSDWIEDILQGGSPQAWAQGAFAEYYPDLPMRYRSHWYVVNGDHPMVFGLGIHGQNLFIDWDNQIVISKVSSQPLPLDSDQISLTMRAVAAIRRRLATVPSKTR